MRGGSSEMRAMVGVLSVGDVPMETDAAAPGRDIGGGLSRCRDGVGGGPRRRRRRSTSGPGLTERLGSGDDGSRARWHSAGDQGGGHAAAASRGGSGGRRCDVRRRRGGCRRRGGVACRVGRRPSRPGWPIAAGRTSAGGVRVAVRRTRVAEPVSSRSRADASTTQPDGSLPRAWASPRDAARRAEPASRRAAWTGADQRAGARTARRDGRDGDRSARLTPVGIGLRRRERQAATADTGSPEIGPGMTVTSRSRPPGGRWTTRVDAWRRCARGRRALHRRDEAERSRTSGCSRADATRRGRRELAPGRA